MSIATLGEHALQVSLGLKRIPKNGPDYTPRISSRVKCEIPRSRVTRMSVATRMSETDRAPTWLNRRTFFELAENVGEGTNNRNDLAHDLNRGRNAGDLDGQPLLRCPSVFRRRTQQCARHADTAVWLNHCFRFFGLTYFGTCFYRRQTGFYSANRYQLSSKLLASRQVRGLRQTCRPGEPGGRGAA